MNAAVVLAFVKRFLPMNKIGAYILGLIAAAMAVFLGVSNSDLKDSFCASAPVSIPAAAVPEK